MVLWFLSLKKEMKKTLGNECRGVIRIRLEREMDAEGDCRQGGRAGTAFSHAKAIPRPNPFCSIMGLFLLCTGLEFPHGNTGNPRGFMFQGSCCNTPVAICLPSKFLSYLCKLCK